MTFNKMMQLVNSKNGVGAIFYYNDGCNVPYFFEDMQSAGLGIDRASAQFDALHEAGKIHKAIYYWKGRQNPAIVGELVKVHFFDTMHGCRPIRTQQDENIYKVYKQDGRIGIDYAGQFEPLDHFSIQNGAVALEVI